MNDEDFKKKLTLKQYRVLREKRTEAPFTGKAGSEAADFLTSARGVRFQSSPCANISQHY